tara:strand:- start:161 stop:808 length:648 start_codon:yes stop_codon:yes gene_type:complete
MEHQRFTILTFLDGTIEKITLTMRKLILGITILATASSTYASTKIENEVDKPTPIEVVEYVKPKWDCPDCNSNERYVLDKLQEYTKISDRNALATLMGNIKSESNFHADICEGGARVPYNQCHSGGYGLIQWTTISRYNGLGSFCDKYECDPSSLEGQVRYMVNENQFQKVLPEFEGGGQTVRQYMVPSFYWLGWGIKGYREQYAYEYSKKLVWV